MAGCFLRSVWKRVIRICKAPACCPTLTTIIIIIIIIIISSNEKKKKKKKKKAKKSPQNKQKQNPPSITAIGRALKKEEYLLTRLEPPADERMRGETGRPMAAAFLCLIVLIGSTSTIAVRAAGGPPDPSQFLTKQRSAEEAALAAQLAPLVDYEARGTNDDLVAIDGPGLPVIEWDVTDPDFKSKVVAFDEVRGRCRWRGLLLFFFFFFFFFFVVVGAIGFMSRFPPHPPTPVFAGLCSSPFIFLFQFPACSRCLSRGRSRTGRRSASGHPSSLWSSLVPRFGSGGVCLALPPIFCSFAL